MNATAEGAVVYPGTQTLVNKAGIQEPAVLAAFERAATSARFIELFVNPVRPTFDLAHVTEIHRRLFQDVYSWAGQLRTAAVSVESTALRSFFAPTREQSVSEYGESVLEGLRHPAVFRPDNKEHFAAILAGHYDLLSYWHPFRLGNDRTLRIFAGQIAHEAGYHLEYARTDYTTLGHALVATEFDDRGPLRSVFRTIAVPQRARAFTQALEDRNEANALQRHPELKGAFEILSMARERLGSAENATPGSVKERRYQNVIASLQRQLGNGAVPPDASEKVVQQLLWSARGLDR